MQIAYLTEFLYGLLILSLGSYSSSYSYRWPIKFQYLWEKEAHQMLAKPFHKLFPFQYKARSYCPKCHNTLKLIDLIPLASFCLLKGKCQYCLHKIPCRYPIVELTHVVFCLPLLWLIQDLYSLLLYTFLLSSLITTATIDFEHKLIPDECNFFGLACVLLINVSNETLEGCVFGILLGYISISLLNTIYTVFRKQEGIGLGDAKLTAVLGGWVSVYSLPTMLACASLMGILYSLLIHKNQKAFIPFGPFLILSAFMVIFYKI